MKKVLLSAVLVLIGVMVFSQVPAGLEFEIARGSVTIIKYTGNATSATIPPSKNAQ